MQFGQIAQARQVSSKDVAADRQRIDLRHVGQGAHRATEPVAGNVQLGH